MEIILTEVCCCLHELQLEMKSIDKSHEQHAHDERVFKFTDNFYTSSTSGEYCQAIRSLEYKWHPQRYSHVDSSTHAQEF